MTGRLSLLAFVGAAGMVHGLRSLPRPGVLAAGLAGVFLYTLMVMWWRSRPRHGGQGVWGAAFSWRVVWMLWAAAAGFGSTVLRAEHRLIDTLAPVHENKVARVVVQVASLPRLDPGRRVFEALVLSAKPEGVPARIRIAWSASGAYGTHGGQQGQADAFPDIIPGQIWRMALTMRPPWGPRNPHAFDYEKHLFAQGVRATGTVRGSPRLLSTPKWVGLSITAERARHQVREAMRPYVEGRRYGAVLLALAIGDQASVSVADWQVFNRSGITHLVSISGSHVTMVAALGGGAVFALWRRLRWRGRLLAERMPAQVCAGLVALFLAWLYCLLAGWGVPARRTFLMLAVVGATYALRLPVVPSSVLSLAAFAVILLDPWAILASGFWLSFAAVAVLLASSSWAGKRVAALAPGRSVQIRDFLLAALRLQLAVSLALTPALALLFHEVSAVSPLSNAYAIPVIGLFVTPLALLSAGAALVPGLGMVADLLAGWAHAAFQVIMVPTVWLAGLPAASFPVAAAPLWVSLLAVPGIVLALLPYGAPLRHAAWLLFLPALCWRPDRPAPGEWTLHALDVGQAGAIVVQTARHTMLFDTGARRGHGTDDGMRVILPYLRALGVRRLDTLVVSHADMDHAGGLESVLAALPVTQSFSSFDLSSHLLHGSANKRSAQLTSHQASSAFKLPARVLRCVRGQAWEVDGVMFEFLWPATDRASSQDASLPGQATSEQTRRKNMRNNQSCVLRVVGAHHSALLTGDIGARQEEMLVSGGLGATDLVMVAHHGSRHSSSPLFVLATRAAHVIAQAGPWSRHGHPSGAIEKRWQRAGARFWRSDFHGAVIAHSSAASLSLQAERYVSRRYWTTQLADDG